jgi:hypothetical protein
MVAAAAISCGSASDSMTKGSRTFGLALIRARTKALSTVTTISTARF